MKTTKHVELIWLKRWFGFCENATCDDSLAVRAVGVVNMCFCLLRIFDLNL